MAAQAVTMHFLNAMAGIATTVMAVAGLAAQTLEEDDDDDDDQPARHGCHPPIACGRDFDINMYDDDTAVHLFR
jgi:hypothetical protein